jgi:septal ring-binding cell division protein DamX
MATAGAGGAAGTMTDEPRRRRTAAWIGAALAGLVLAAGLTTAAAQLSNQRVGLSSEPLTAGQRLAPSATPARTPTRTPRPARTATPRPVRTATPAATPAADDHGGDDGGGGRGRGRSHGEDD